MKWGKKPKERPVDTGPMVAEGDRARAIGRWDLAVERYGAALAVDPKLAAVRVQLGHGMKELGRLTEAEIAYRLAASLRPDDPDACLHLGHVLKLQGQPDQAIEAYAEALRRQPDFEPARTELVAAGKRSLLPEAAYGRSAVTDALTQLSSSLRSRETALARLSSVSVFPIEAYDAFRQTYPILPPPAAPATPEPVHVVIDAWDAQPAQVRLTLASLIDQNRVDWTAVVRGCGAMVDHPVASIARQDARIVFLPDTEGFVSWGREDGPLLLCDAGTVLDPWALSWLTFAQSRTGADAVYADHDHHTRHWRDGRIHVDPVFQAMPDRWDMRGTPTPPAVVMLGASAGGTRLQDLSDERGPALRRRLLHSAISAGARVAHVPRLLSSVRVEHLDAPRPPSPGIAPETLVAGEDLPLIRVIVPTRDERAVLEACIDSLLAKAARPERLRLQVVDNRSVSQDTIDYLATLQATGRAQVDPFDEPFNWARLNNLAAADDLEGSILVFANNDIEMLTDGWDDRLVEALRAPDVGVVGVRLLYPDRTVQHAGMVLGVNHYRPVHDGLGRAEREGGPADRWKRTRQVSAVTGAFMAVGRGVLDRLGGFDESLAIGYNDVDFCLRARAQGLAVLYDPAIELIHHESKTRGHQDSDAKVAWDDIELTHLHERWRGWMMFDPGKNPQWFSTESRPFDGLRDLTLSETVRHIDLSARPLPWSIDDTIDPHGEGA